jgi:hypothetical protein
MPPTTYTTIYDMTGHEIGVITDSEMARARERLIPRTKAALRKENKELMETIEALRARLAR